MINLFEHLYPYTDFHELNLDWVIKRIIELTNTMNQFEALNTVTFKGVWDITKAYPKWSIVTYNNGAYLSTDIVPAGIDITDSNYWELIYTGDAIIEEIADSYAPTIKSRRVIALADSYGMVTNPGMYEMMQSNAGIDDMIIDSTSGRSFARATNTFLEAIQTIDGNINNQDQITDIIVTGGYNDGQYINGGGSAATVVSKIQTFINYCKAHFKNAKIYIGFLGWTKGTAGISKGVILQALECYKEGAKYGAIYLNNVEYVLRNIRLLDNDTPGGYHPNYDGAVELARCIFQSWITGTCETSITERISANFTPNTAFGTLSQTSLYLYIFLKNGLANMFGPADANINFRSNTGPNYMGSYTADDWVEILEDTNPVFNADDFNGTAIALIRHYPGGVQTDTFYNIQIKYEASKLYFRAPETLTDMRILQIRGLNITTNTEY